jgi:hypothetical protein
LIQVNVAWGGDAPNKPSGANAIVAAGTRLVSYFLGFGIKYQMNREGYQPTLADPKGPPKLLINYIADRDHPDVAKIEPGKF